MQQNLNSVAQKLSRYLHVRCLYFESTCQCNFLGCFKKQAVTGICEKQVHILPFINATKAGASLGFFVINLKSYSPIDTQRVSLYFCGTFLVLFHLKMTVLHTREWLQAF